MIAKGANINSRDERSKMPLYAAVYLSGRETGREVAELLIAKGADVNARDKWDRTPLGIVGYSHEDLADLRRRHGGK